MKIFKLAESISGFFDHWKTWGGAVLVYQVLMIVTKLSGMIDRSWPIILLPVEIIGTLFILGLSLVYLILRK